MEATIGWLPYIFHEFTWYDPNMFPFVIAKMLEGLKAFEKSGTGEKKVVNRGDHPSHIQHQDYNIYPGIIVVHGNRW